MVRFWAVQTHQGVTPGLLLSHVYVFKVKSFGVPKGPLSFKSIASELCGLSYNDFGQMGFAVTPKRSPAGALGKSSMASQCPFRKCTSQVLCRPPRGPDKDPSQMFPKRCFRGQPKNMEDEPSGVHHHRVVGTKRLHFYYIFTMKKFGAQFRRRPKIIRRRPK